MKGWVEIKDGSRKLISEKKKKLLNLRKVDRNDLSFFNRVHRLLNAGSSLDHTIDLIEIIKVSDIYRAISKPEIGQTLISTFQVDQAYSSS